MSYDISDHRVSRGLWWSSRPPALHLSRLIEGQYKLFLLWDPKTKPALQIVLIRSSFNQKVNSWEHIHHSAIYIYLEVRKICKNLYSLGLCYLFSTVNSAISCEGCCKGIITEIMYVKFFEHAKERGYSQLQMFKAKAFYGVALCHKE